MTQVNGSEKRLQSHDHLLLPFHFRPSILIAFSFLFFSFFGAKFRTTFNNTLSCTSYSNQLGIIYRPPLAHLIFLIKMSRTL